MLGKKMQDLFQLALGVAVARDGIPEEAGDLLNEMFSHMCAKQIALCANNGGLTKDSGKTEAEELMSWVDKIIDIEQNVAKSILDSEGKTKGK
jgi:hypothetical protein